jgi:Protein of unknown function (DUF1461)
VRLRFATVLSALIVAAVPVVLIGNALWVLVNPWLVHAEYALPGFPDDDFDLSDQERTDLAVTGVRSIRPGGDGVEQLREARLPDGNPAFVEREIQHMEDVRSLVTGSLIAWGIALVLAVSASLALRRLGGPAPFRLRWTREAGPVGSALVAGACLTIVAIGLAGVVMLIDFELFFDGFHGVFFEGDSWQFSDKYTLRQLYPDFFWGVAGGAMAALVAFQVAALIAACTLRGR